MKTQEIDVRLVASKMLGLSLTLLLSACSGDAKEVTGGASGSPSAAGGMTNAGAGGASPSGAGGAVTTAGRAGTGGAPSGIGGTASGGTPAAGGVMRAGGGGGGRATGGSAGSGGGAMGGSAGSLGGSTGTAGASSGTCTASTAVNRALTGTGPHKVTVEANSDPGIKEGTIIRPTDLGGTEKYPIFAWGEGGCMQQGLSNAAAMGEIASHGYFVIADGTPNGGLASRSMSDTVSMGKPLLAYISWAIAENEKPCSAYYHSLDVTKIATSGFSCGGLMAEGTAGDPRITTWMLNSSGLFAADQALYSSVHTPVLIVLGGSGDIAYTNGKRDYDSISALGKPTMLFSKALGHGGDLASANGGDFTRLDVAWLNWWLKGDETATGKGFLVGDTCTLCKDSAWEKASKNIP